MLFGLITICIACTSDDNTSNDQGCTETTWYQDLDNDGLGNPAVSQNACDQPTGYVADNTDVDDDCTPTTWYQDLDGDGLGNPNVSQDACEQPSGYVSDNTDTNDSGNTATLHDAFAEFDADNTDIALSGNNVIIQTNGMANHTSPYWSNTTERCATPPNGGQICTNTNTTVNHALFVEPTATTYQFMAPGNIDDFNGSYSLTVSATPSLATNSTATGLGAIGIAVSGANIYNDQEGPNVPLDNAISSFDYTAAHTGPQSYHYHLEPKAWTDDDENLIGIIADGFFIYGRKCNSTGTYPTDLDVSGGHTSTTQHTTTAEYHYHIQNELYLNQYYILFPGDYQGTPSNIQ